MATYHEINLTDAPFVAGEDLTAKQYHFVSVSTGCVVAATGASNPGVLGILQNSPSSGQEARVRLLGPSKIVASPGACNLTQGRLVTTASHARAIGASGGLGDLVLGMWLSGSVSSGSAVGEIFFYGITACIPWQN